MAVMALDGMQTTALLQAAIEEEELALETQEVEQSYLAQLMISTALV